MLDQLKMALVGGGGVGFIGKVHATAATLDRQADLVAGALSSDPDRARSAAAAFGLSEDRAYRTYGELIESELQRDVDDRVDFVSIATPNHTHCEIAVAALEAGFHVVCADHGQSSILKAETLTGCQSNGRPAYFAF